MRVGIEERIKFFENLKKGDRIEVQFKRYGGVDYEPPIINQYTVTNNEIQKVKNGSDYIQGILFEFDNRLKNTWVKTKYITALAVDDVIVK